jgi:uncharacterized protein YbjT (DUF2867 family)
MKVLLTGSTGYIGKRLFQVLSDQGDEINCFVRNASRLTLPEHSASVVRKFEVDLLRPIPADLQNLDIDVAFYLVHSMSASINDFMEEEAVSAKHFADFIGGTNCKQIIYLSGISNSPELSKHLKSRRNVEEILKKAAYRPESWYYCWKWKRFLRNYPRPDGKITCNDCPAVGPDPVPAAGHQRCVTVFYRLHA